MLKLVPLLVMGGTGQDDGCLNPAPSFKILPNRGSDRGWDDEKNTASPHPVGAKHFSPTFKKTVVAMFSNQKYALPGSHPNHTHGSVLTPTLRLLRQVVGVDRVPVHHIPKGGNVVRTAVLIMQIIGMFPNVQTQNRHMSVHQGTVLVGG